VTPALAGSIPIGPYPLGLAYDSWNGYVYVTNGVHNLTAINTSTNAVNGSVVVGEIPWGVAFDDANGYLYVANTNSNNVSVVDGVNDTLVDTLPVGFDPIAVAADDANGYIYVANWNNLDGNVTVINGSTDKVVGSVPAGSDPDAVAYDNASGDVFVSNFLSDNVTVFNGATGSAVGSVSVGSWPRALAVDDENGEVYVANYDSNNVSVIDGANDTLVESIANVSAPYAMTFDNSNGYVYVTDYGSSNVSVINGETNTLVGSFPVGSSPAGIAYDNANGYLYVANYDSGNVTVNTSSAPSCPSCYAVTFTETGLPEGTFWSVNTSGVNRGSVGSAITFDLPNGGYDYTFGNVTGFHSNTSEGSLVVSGEALAESVVFARNSTSMVSFSESGLPPDGLWNITLGTDTQRSRGTFVNFSEPNGSYSFAVSSPGFSPTPASGLLTLVGSTVNVNISFIAVTYPVTFNETGLPAGGGWSVAVGSGRTVGVGPIVVYLANGTHDWSASAFVASYYYGAMGNVTVAGQPLNVSVFFDVFPPTFALTISENGLPSGANWTVLAGSEQTGAETSMSTLNASLTLYLTNGTYTLGVVGPPGYNATISSSTWIVNGPQSTQLTVTFTGGPCPCGAPSGGTKVSWTEVGVFIGIAVVIGIVATGLLLAESRRPPTAPP